MINISKRNDGEKRFAEYFLQSNDRIDNLTLGMLVNNNIEGINPVTPVQIGNDRVFKYDITKYVTLKEYFGESVKREKLLTAFYGIAVSMKIATDYMINWTSFVLDVDHIYVDKETGKTSIICIPLLTVINDGNTCNFFKNILFTAEFDEEENGDYIIGKLVTLLKPKTYTIDKFIYELEEMLGIEHRVFETYNEKYEEEIVIETEQGKAEEVKETAQTANENTQAPKAAQAANESAEAPKEVKAASEGTEAPKTEVKETVEQAKPQPAKEAETAKTEIKETVQEIKNAANEQTQAEVKETVQKTEEAVKQAESAVKTEVKEEVQAVQAEIKQNAEAAKTEVKENTEAIKAETKENIEAAKKPEEAAKAAEAVNAQVQQTAEAVKEEVKGNQGKTNPVKESFFKVKFKDDASETEGEAVKADNSNGTAGMPEQEADNNSPFLYNEKGNVQISVKKERFMIGSDKATCDYVIKDNPKVETNHAVIVRKDGEYYISQVNENTVILVDHDIPFSPDEEMPLEDGSEIEIAGEILKFNIQK